MQKRTVYISTSGHSVERGAVKEGRFLQSKTSIKGIDLTAIVTPEV